MIDPEIAAAELCWGANGFVAGCGVKSLQRICTYSPNPAPTNSSVVQFLGLS